MTESTDRHEQDESATVADPWSPRGPEPADDRRDDFDPVAAAQRIPWLTGLVAVHVLAASVGIGWLGREDGWIETNETIGAAILSIAFAQGSLFGIWAAMAGRGTPWRFSLLILLVVAGTKGLVDDKWWTTQDEWFCCLLGQMLGTSVPFFLLRFFGLQMRQKEPDPALPRMFRPQFTIMAMLQWMVAVAVLFGTVPLMPERFLSAFATREAFLLLGLFGIAAIIGVTAIWLAIGSGWLGLRISGVLLVAIALAVFLAVTDVNPEIVFSFSVLYPLWLLASLAVLRKLGYRVGWRRASGGGVSPEPSPGATIS